MNTSTVVTVFLMVWDLGKRNTLPKRGAALSNVTQSVLPWFTIQFSNYAQKH